MDRELQRIQKTPARGIHIKMLMSAWEYKMGKLNTELLNQWIRFGPGVIEVDNLSMLQAMNMIQYINSHDGEQILAHIMDLAPR